jgi:hypothetical protein
MYLPGTNKVVCDDESCDGKIVLPNDVKTEESANRYVKAVRFWVAEKGEHRCIYCQ